MYTQEQKGGERLKLQQGLIGVVEFDDGIICFPETLASYPISIGGSAGELTLPRVPKSLERGDSLLSPSDYDVGLNTESWGAVIDHDGTSLVTKACMTFDIPVEDIRRVSNDIYQDFPLWISRLKDFIDLVTKQRFHRNLFIEEIPGKLSLYHLSSTESCKLEDSWEPKLYGSFNAEDRSLTNKQFNEICDVVSSGRELSLDYQFQLAGYRAFKQNNFRLAIVESATAAEISLKNGILSQMKKDGVAYAEGLMGDRLTLGGLEKFARIVGYKIPQNFVTDLVKPRNRVVHHGDTSDAQTAEKALLCVDEILTVGNPDQFHP